jgi:hypothetical protein
LTDSWYARIIRDPNDLSPVLDACDYFEGQYILAVAEADEKQLRGKLIREVAMMLPGMVGYRCNQMYELEAIIEYLEIREKAIAGDKRHHYLEHYNRALTPTTVEKYVESDAMVLDLAILRNQVTLIRNKFRAISKHHEYLHYQISNITALVKGGVDDAIL